MLGPIAAEAMGITLPHEHLLVDFEVMFTEPGGGSERGLSRQRVSLANLGWIRQHFSSNLDDLQLLDEKVARDEALPFLIERGHLAQVLMSHDIAYKHCLTKWSGFGYHHLLVNAIPRLRAKGADDKAIQTLLVDNPRSAFAYA